MIGEEIIDILKNKFGFSDKEARNLLNQKISELEKKIRTKEIKRTLDEYEEEIEEEEL